MKRPIISIIACIGKNRELGYNNDLIWKIPEDLKYFKSVTSGHVVIMGQRTYESIGRALPERTNIVLSDKADFAPSDAIVARSMDDALSKANEYEEVEIFFIGGAYVYSQAIEFADRLYLTLVDDSAHADSFFPKYDEYVELEKVDQGSYKGIKYKFIVLEKNA